MLSALLNKALASCAADHHQEPEERDHEEGAGPELRGRVLRGHRLSAAQGQRLRHALRRSAEEVRSHLVERSLW